MDGKVSTGMLRDHKEVHGPLNKAGSWLAWRAVGVALGAGTVCTSMETI